MCLTCFSFGGKQVKVFRCLKIYYTCLFKVIFYSNYFFNIHNIIASKVCTFFEILYIFFLKHVMSYLNKVFEVSILHTILISPPQPLWWWVHWHLLKMEQCHRRTYYDSFVKYKNFISFMMILYYIDSRMLQIIPSFQLWLQIVHTSMKTIEPITKENTDTSAQ